MGVCSNACTPPFGVGFSRNNTTLKALLDKR
jgi:hypothetical protein